MVKHHLFARRSGTDLKNSVNTVNDSSSFVWHFVGGFSSPSDILLREQLLVHLFFYEFIGSITVGMLFFYLHQEGISILSQTERGPFKPEAGSLHLHEWQ